MAARHFCWKPGKNGRVGVKGPEGSIKNTISVIWEQSKPVHSMHHWLWLKNMPSGVGIAMAPSHRRAHYIAPLTQAASVFTQRKIYYQTKHVSRVKTRADTPCEFRHNVTGSRWSGSDHSCADLKELGSVTFLLNQVGKRRCHNYPPRFSII